MRFTDERLLLRLTGITIILLFTTALSVSEESTTMSPSQRVILNSKKERIAELYTFTKWEDDNPSVLIAAAQTLAKYHTLAIPHPASVDEYFSISEKLKKSIDVVLPQIDKLKTAKQDLSMEAILGFKDIVGTLEEKLNEWPSVLVWSSAERIGEDGPPKPPSDRLLVHRGFDTANFFLSQIIGDNLNWLKDLAKLDELLFFEMYCKQIHSILHDPTKGSKDQCEDIQYLETLRIEKNIFMLQAQSAKALKFLEEALLSGAKGDNESTTKNVQRAAQLIYRVERKHKQILLNMAHSNRAKETFADSPMPSIDL
eukprot:g9452.t1